MGNANSQAAPMGDVKGVDPVYGGTWPAITWQAFMSQALAGVPATPFTEPAPIVAPHAAPALQAGAHDHPAGRTRPAGRRSRGHPQGGPYQIPPPTFGVPEPVTTTVPPTSTTVRPAPPPSTTSTTAPADPGVDHYDQPIVDRTPAVIPGGRGQWWRRLVWRAADLTSTRVVLTPSPVVVTSVRMSLGGTTGHVDAPGRQPGGGQEAGLVRHLRGRALGHFDDDPVRGRRPGRPAGMPDPGHAGGRLEPHRAPSFLGEDAPEHERGDKNPARCEPDYLSNAHIDPLPAYQTTASLAAGQCSPRAGRAPCCTPPRRREQTRLRST